MRTTRRFSPHAPQLLVVCLLALFAQQAAAQESAGVFSTTFTSGGRTLTIELLDDDLAHFELTLEGENTSPIELSPMVAATNYPGPSSVEQVDETRFETPEILLAVDPTTLCVQVTDKTHLPDLVLTTVCPGGEAAEAKSLTFTRETTTDIYGLGELFPRRGGTDGNWFSARHFSNSQYGNSLIAFNGGNVGAAEFPVFYALGEGENNYAVFLDNAYQHYWAFTGDAFKVDASAGPMRWYIMTGPNLRDLRSDYLELTGRPPVPPQQMFGLWVSEYGYEDWAELEGVIESLQAANFPFDGFLLDLQWFGGITPAARSQMGALQWDEENFPNPAEYLADLRETTGAGIMMIEEPYVSISARGYDEVAEAGVLVRECAETTCAPIELNSWWGSGSMVDWTDETAAAWWHDERRQPLIEDGIIGHWTDLGEPEDFSEAAWYDGVFDGLNDHASIHNLYNLLWSESIWEGYARHGNERRPFILSRSGTSGSQRYGVSMWSGDIAANNISMTTHMNAQMHMSLSGIDYFGSDIGGFYSAAADPVFDRDEMYTIWLANSALIDVPLRPHTFNVQNSVQTAPSLVGNVDSNLANVRQRYQLGPYLYTQAHLAYRDGSAVFAPLVYFFQTDTAVRSLGSQKMIGPDLMMTAITGYPDETIPVYLPAGTWINYYTQEVIESEGQTVDAPLTIDGLMRAPMFVRAGAIIPEMLVDDETMTMLGRREDNSTAPLVLKVYAGEGTPFTLIEDDGETMAYQSGAVRETVFSHTQADDSWTITLGAANGSYEGAVDQRAYEIHLIGSSNPVGQVTLDGVALPMLDSAESLASASEGWFTQENGSTVVKLATLPVDAEHVVQAQAAPEAQAAAQPDRPLLMAHYMPWYQAPPVASQWGWHWTMEHFNPNQVDENGRREVASQYMPLIGPYDSRDPAVLEYQVLMMKLSGIDGVIIDWYGTARFRDYAEINESTVALIDYVRRAGLQFALCYEDNTVNFMRDSGLVREDTALEHGHEVMSYADENWFNDPLYLRFENNPLLFIFGPQYYRNPSDWETMFEGLQSSPSLVTLDGHMGFGALATYPWPPMHMSGGIEMPMSTLHDYFERFFRNARRGELIVGGAFPGFHDIYAQAEVRSTYGFIDWRNGDTLRETLAISLAENPDIIQLITWNDYGEGTMIEPTVEHGYESLETVQSTRRDLEGDTFAFTADDLHLPQRLFDLRRRFEGDVDQNAALDQVFDAIVAGDLETARALLDQFEALPES